MKTQKTPGPTESPLDQPFSELTLKEPLSTSNERKLIPDEIFYKIFEYLNSSSLRNCVTVSHAWNAILTSKPALTKLWRSVIYHEHTINTAYWRKTDDRRTSLS